MILSVIDMMLNDPSGELQQRPAEQCLGAADEKALDAAIGTVVTGPDGKRYYVAADRMQFVRYYLFREEDIEDGVPTDDPAAYADSDWWPVADYNPNKEVQDDNIT